MDVYSLASQFLVCNIYLYFIFNSLLCLNSFSITFLTVMDNGGFLLRNRPWEDQHGYVDGCLIRLYSLVFYIVIFICIIFISFRNIPFFFSLKSIFNERVAKADTLYAFMHKPRLFIPKGEHGVWRRSILHHLASSET